MKATWHNWPKTKGIRDKFVHCIQSSLPTLLLSFEVLGGVKAIRGAPYICNMHVDEQYGKSVRRKAGRWWKVHERERSHTRTNFSSPAKLFLFEKLRMFSFFFFFLALHIGQVDDYFSFSQEQ